MGSWLATNGLVAWRRLLTPTCFRRQSCFSGVSSQPSSLLMPTADFRLYATASRMTSRHSLRSHLTRHNLDYLTLQSRRVFMSSMVFYYAHIQRRTLQVRCLGIASPRLSH